MFHRSNLRRRGAIQKNLTICTHLFHLVCSFLLISSTWKFSKVLLGLLHSIIALSDVLCERTCCSLFSLSFSFFCTGVTLPRVMDRKPHRTLAVAISGVTENTQRRNATIRNLSDWLKGTDNSFLATFYWKWMIANSKRATPLSRRQFWSLPSTTSKAILLTEPPETFQLETPRH